MPNALLAINTDIPRIDESQLGSLKHIHVPLCKPFYTHKNEAFELKPFHLRSNGATGRKLSVRISEWAPIGLKNQNE